jgi:hypothetical protein
VRGQLLYRRRDKLKFGWTYMVMEAVLVEEDMVFLYDISIRIDYQRE